MFAILAAVLVGGVAYAAIPGPDGSIHGCYRPPHGQLRVIDADAGATCDPGEVSIVLSQPAALACPTGTTAFVGVCIENTARTAADHGDATRDCADEARRLPSGGELQGFRELDGITLPAAEWTDDLGDVTLLSSFVYLAVTETGNGVEDAFVPLAYRCVAGMQLQ